MGEKTETKERKPKSFRDALDQGNEDALELMLNTREVELISKYGPGGEHEAKTGWAQEITPGSIEYDEDADKISVEVLCHETKEPFRVFTSDLFQKRHSNEGIKIVRRERAKQRRAELKAEREAKKEAEAGE